MKRRPASFIPSRIGRSRRVERHAGPLAPTLLLAAALAALAGCGQKGPLVLPDRGAAPAASAPAGAPTRNDDGDERERERRVGDDAR